jgi:uncharacterized repeat protein (TIGR03803 family)
MNRVLRFGLMVLAALGSIFFLTSASANAQSESVLHSFGSIPGDGAFPYGGLLFEEGNLYGTTHANPSGDFGNVFEITAEGEYEVLYNFGSQSGDGIGPRPFGGLAFRGGKLYGTAFEGGAPGGVGTVFDLTLKGKEKVLHTFGIEPGDGVYPAAGVIFDKEGNLYGTTEEGGAGICEGGCGIVYEVTKSGEEKVLYSFGGQYQDAVFPTANLTFDKAGNLYGTTDGGGVYAGGTVFELSAAGVEKVLYSFNRQSGDGNYPASGVVFDKKGNIYGTTFYGGIYGQGTVFELSSSGEEKLLYSFGGQPSDGINAYGSVVFDKEGNLYGTTFAGGIYGQGTAFELSPSGKEKLLYTFGSQAGDGNTPLGGLVFDTAGNLYGVTAYGGVYGFGTVFEITP